MPSKPPSTATQEKIPSPEQRPPTPAKARDTADGRTAPKSRMRHRRKGRNSKARGESGGRLRLRSRRGESMTYARITGALPARCNTANAAASRARTGQGSTGVLKMRRPASGEDFLLLAGPKLVAGFSSDRPKIRTYGGSNHRPAPRRIARASRVAINKAPAANPCGLQAGASVA